MIVDGAATQEVSRGADLQCINRARRQLVADVLVCQIRRLYVQALDVYSQIAL